MRWFRSAALVALVIGACSDDPSGPKKPVIVGNYTLETINGQALPFTIASVSAAYIIQQVSGTFALNADSTYRENALLKEYINGVDGIVVNDIPVSFNGRWQAEDSVVTVVEGTTGEFGFGFVSQNRLTISFELGDSLFTYVYRRQQ